MEVSLDNSSAVAYLSEYEPDYLEQIRRQYPDLKLSKGKALGGQAAEEAVQSDTEIRRKAQIQEESLSRQAEKAGVYLGRRSAKEGRAKNFRVTGTTSLALGSGVGFFSSLSGTDVSAFFIGVTFLGAVFYAISEYSGLGNLSTLHAAETADLLANIDKAHCLRKSLSDIRQGFVGYDRESVIELCGQSEDIVHKIHMIFLRLDLPVGISRVAGA